MKENREQIIRIVIVTISMIILVFARQCTVDQYPTDIEFHQTLMLIIVLTCVFIVMLLVKLKRNKS